MGKSSVELLNGKDIPEQEFDNQFKKIVGCTFDEWIKKPTTKNSAGEEWYEWRDEKFTLGGTVYAPPVLYKN